MKTVKSGLLLAGMLGLSACTQQEPPPAAKIDPGRPETRNIEAADAMGYNGKVIRKQVDAALNANDAAVEQQKQALEAQQ